MTSLLVKTSCILTINVSTTLFQDSKKQGLGKLIDDLYVNSSFLYLTNKFTENNTLQVPVKVIFFCIYALKAYYFEI